MGLRIKLIDINSQMVTVSSSLLKEDFSTSVAPLDIHLSLCHAHSPIKLLLKLTFGKTETTTNTPRVKFTNSLDFIYQPSVLSLLSSPRIKLTTLMFNKPAHSSTSHTDIDQFPYCINLAITLIHS